MRALWTDVGIRGHKAIDIGVGVGPLLSAWITTDGAIYAWNGRAQEAPAGDAELPLEWETWAAGERASRPGPTPPRGW